MSNRRARTRSIEQLIDHTVTQSLYNAHVIARSAELVARSITNLQTAALACSQAARLCAEVRRDRLRSPRRATRPPALGLVAQVDAWMLTPTMLRELAVEFGIRESSAVTPESR